MFAAVFRKKSRTTGRYSTPVSIISAWAPFSGVHIRIALIDLGEGVPLRHKLVELKFSAPVQTQEQRNVAVNVHSPIH
ncbi:MAG: hypothetical protein ACRD4F_01685, partial [Candidatus Angelobacter sp.]